MIHYCREDVQNLRNFVRKNAAGLGFNRMIADSLFPNDSTSILEMITYIGLESRNMCSRARTDIHMLENGMRKFLKNVYNRIDKTKTSLIEQRYAAKEVIAIDLSLLHLQGIDKFSADEIARWNKLMSDIKFVTSDGFNFKVRLMAHYSRDGILDKYSWVSLHASDKWRVYQTALAVANHLGYKDA